MSVVEDGERRVTCVRCPMGCQLSVEVRGGEVASVTGNACPRGAAYGASEVTNPVRVVTSLMRVDGSARPVSVRTAGEVPRASVPEVLARIHATIAEPPVRAGETLVPDVAGTGVDVVATRDVPA